jgi:hypothetical protein
MVDVHPSSEADAIEHVPDEAMKAVSTGTADPDLPTVIAGVRHE